jgi:hypothetical protein
MKRFFGKKRRVPLVELMDGRGKTIYLDTIDRLSIPESVILDMSIEFFNDPAPCVIHRSAVLSRAHEEIRSEISEERTIASLPMGLRRYFGLYEALSVRVEDQRRES